MQAVLHVSHVPVRCPCVGHLVCAWSKRSVTTGSGGVRSVTESCDSPARENHGCGCLVRGAHVLPPPASRGLGVRGFTAHPKLGLCRLCCQHRLLCGWCLASHRPCPPLWALEAFCLPRLGFVRVPILPVGVVSVRSPWSPCVFLCLLRGRELSPYWPHHGQGELLPEPFRGPGTGPSLLVAQCQFQKTKDKTKKRT